MAIEPKDGNLLYHLTALSNLENIFKKGLRSRSKLEKFEDIADDDIINHRKTHSLDSFVPFHFFSKTPFAGTVQKSHVAKDFVYITVTREFAKKSDFKIIPSHPLHCHYEVLDYEEGFSTIDWKLIAKRDYANHECKQACMAECLSKKTVKKEDFYGIYTKSGATKKAIEDLYSKLFEEAPKFIIKTDPYMFV